MRACRKNIWLVLLALAIPQASSAQSGDVEFEFPSAINNNNVVVGASRHTMLEGSFHFPVYPYLGTIYDGGLVYSGENEWLYDINNNPNPFAVGANANRNPLIWWRDGTTWKRKEIPFYAPDWTPGSLNREAYRINDRSEILGSFFSSDWKQHTWMIRNGQPVDLDSKVSGWSGVYPSDINNQGVILAQAKKTQADDGTALPSNQQTTYPVLLMPIDVSISLGYAGGDMRLSVDLALAEVPNLIGTPYKQGDFITYLYKGKDSAGNSKIWVVQTSSNKESFINALKNVPYVFFGGHANSGAGFAMKSTANGANFDCRTIGNINDFLHIRNAQTALPWRDFQDDPAEYPNFGSTAIAADQIPNNPTNIAVVKGFTDANGNPAPILDAAGNPCDRRYPDTDNTPIGGTYNLHNPGGGVDQYHMYQEVLDDHTLPFIVVNMSNDEIPAFGYKLFVLSVCNGARDYGDVFKHGCLISTNNFADFYGNEPAILVESLLNGGGNTAVLKALNPSTIIDYVQKNF